MNLAIVVVAAGSSRRFGSSKMAYVMPDGRALLEHTLDIYLPEQAKCSDYVVVVVPQGDRTLKARIEQRGGVAIECADSEEGMSASIKTGFSSVLSRSGAIDACMIALGDMPYVARTTVELLVKGAQQDTIVVPCLQSVEGALKHGNPVIFGSAFFPEVLALVGDVGAKAVVTAHPSAVSLVEVKDPGIFHDIDRPEDLIT